MCKERISVIILGVVGLVIWLFSFGCVLGNPMSIFRGVFYSNFIFMESPLIFGAPVFYILFVVFVCCRLRILSLISAVICALFSIYLIFSLSFKGGTDTRFLPICIAMSIMTILCVFYYVLIGRKIQSK